MSKLTRYSIVNAIGPSIHCDRSLSCPADCCCMRTNCNLSILSSSAYRHGLLLLHGHELRSQICLLCNEAHFWTGFPAWQLPLTSICVVWCRFDGYAAEALTFAIMKHDVLWSATDNAILQQWGKGRVAQAKVVKQIEHTLEQADMCDFLDGLDRRPVPADRISSQGFSATIQRMFCYALPPRVLL